MKPPSATPTLVLSAMAALASGPAPALAQLVELVPRIGIHEPATDLADVPGEFGGGTAELESGLALGLALEIAPPASSLGFRVGLDYATGAGISVDGIEQDFEVDLLALAADVVFRPLPKIVLIQPYVMGGGAAKIYNFEGRVRAGEVSELFENETDFGIHGGVGVDIDLGVIAFLVEVSDYLTWFALEDAAGEETENETQHDLFATVGFRVGLF